MIPAFMGAGCRRFQAAFFAFDFLFGLCVSTIPRSFFPACGAVELSGEVIAVSLYSPHSHPANGPVKHESGGTPVFLSAFPVSYSTSIKTAFKPLETRLFHRL
jgi:hypothetical protein